MNSQPLTTKQVQEAARDEIDIGGQTLTIAQSYLWRNNQPRVANDLGEAELDPSEPRAAHISLTIRRKNASHNTDDNLDSSVLPHLVALHVIRLNQPLPDTPSLDGPPPDAPTSKHFAWSAPPTLSALSPEAQEAAYEGGFFLPQSLGDGSSLTLNAWNGPSWGDLRNGIDDMIDYNAVVEFEGGLFLKGRPQRMQVVL